MTRDIPRMFQKLYARAKTGRAQSAAIRSFCLECVGYVFEEVKLCTDTGCPLYEYRMTGRKVPKGAAAMGQTSPTMAVGSPAGAPGARRSHDLRLKGVSDSLPVDSASFSPNEGVFWSDQQWRRNGQRSAGASGRPSLSSRGRTGQFPVEIRIETRGRKSLTAISGRNTSKKGFIHRSFCTP